MAAAIRVCRVPVSVVPFCRLSWTSCFVSAEDRTRDLTRVCVAFEADEEGAVAERPVHRPFLDDGNHMPHNVLMRNQNEIGSGWSFSRGGKRGVGGLWINGFDSASDEDETDCKAARKCRWKTKPDDPSAIAWWYTQDAVSSVVAELDVCKISSRQNGLEP